MTVKHDQNLKLNLLIEERTREEESRTPLNILRKRKRNGNNKYKIRDEKEKDQSDIKSKEECKLLKNILTIKNIKIIAKGIIIHQKPPNQQ